MGAAQQLQLGLTNNPDPELNDDYKVLFVVDKQDITLGEDILHAMDLMCSSLGVPHKVLYVNGASAVNVLENIVETLKSRGDWSCGPSIPEEKAKEVKCIACTNDCFPR